LTIYLNPAPDRHPKDASDIRAEATHSLLCLRTSEGLLLYDRRVRQNHLYPKEKMLCAYLAECSREEALDLWERAQTKKEG
jgi:hypothetical protein